MAASEYPQCAVCERNMLRGERLNEYLDDRRAEVIVCALCKPRAEELGWVPAALAGAVAEPAAPRRRFNLPGGLRERLGRRSESSAGSPEPPAAEPEPVAEPSAFEPDPEPAQAPVTEPAPPPRPLTPVEVFNASPERRTVAGLIRSLGEPRVTVRDETITVAWELSWYQWRVRGERLEQTAKGNEISEIDGADRLWNAKAAEDGVISHG